jgi:hypothetical protein
MAKGAGDMQSAYIIVLMNLLCKDQCCQREREKLRAAP